MNNTTEEDTADLKRVTMLGGIGALVGVFALAGFGLLGRVLMNEENVTANAPMPAVSASGTGLIIRSP